MKRTIIAGAACGAALFAVACTPQDLAGTSSAPASPSASSVSGARTSEPGHSASAQRTPESPATRSDSPSSADATARTEESPAPPTPEAPVSGGASVGSDGQPSFAATASRRGDGRARIGDPCPGLEGTLRPAVNGENLVCAGGPVPRWTVILDQPAPPESAGEPGTATEEPSSPGNGNANGPASGNGNGAARGNGPRVPGHAHANVNGNAPGHAAPAR